METSEVRRLRRGIVAAMAEVKSMHAIHLRKMGRIMRRGPDLVDMDQIEAIVTDHGEAANRYNAASVRFHRPPTPEQLKNHRENTKGMAAMLRGLNKRLDVCEEMFIKYNVPILGEFTCLEAHLLALRAFMRVWREEAKKGREKGEKTLIEWIQKLDESEKSTLDEMRQVVIDLGNHISYHLVMYFTSMEVLVEEEKLERKFGEMAVSIGGLRVEESSVLIETFLLVVQFVKSEIKKRQSEIVAENNNVVSVESVLVNLILREVLRLEVAFSCPDLPMMLTGEVFLGMRNHLVCVFEKRLKRVSLKTDELRSLSPESDGDPGRFEFMTRVLEGVKEIWNKIDLNNPGSN